MQMQSEYEQANKLYAAGYYKKAQDVYQQLSGFSAKYYYESRLMSAYCLLYQGQADEASVLANSVTGFDLKHRAEFILLLIKIFSGNLTHLVIDQHNAHAKENIISLFIDSVFNKNSRAYEKLTLLKDKYSSLSNEFFIIIFLLNCCYLADATIFSYSCTVNELFMVESWKNVSTKAGDITTISELIFISAIVFEKYQKFDLTRSALFSLENLNQNFVLSNKMVERYKIANPSNPFTFFNTPVQVNTFVDPFARPLSEISTRSFPSAATITQASLSVDNKQFFNAAKSVSDPKPDKVAFSEFPQANY